MNPAYKEMSMKTSYIENELSCAIDDRRKQERHYVNEPNQSAEVIRNGNDKPSAKSRAKAAHPVWIKESDAGPRLHMTATDLENHLVRAIVARTKGRVQALRIQVLGGRIVLNGFSESYYAIQLAVAGLMEAINELCLDQPDRVDLNIDVIPSHPARPREV
jgi:hypothetical protein